MKSQALVVASLFLFGLHSGATESKSSENSQITALIKELDSALNVLKDKFPSLEDDPFKKGITRAEAHQIERRRRCLNDDGTRDVHCDFCKSVRNPKLEASEAEFQAYFDTLKTNLLDVGHEDHARLCAKAAQALEVQLKKKQKALDVEGLMQTVANQTAAPKKTPSLPVLEFESKMEGRGAIYSSNVKEIYIRRNVRTHKVTSSFVGSSWASDTEPLLGFDDHFDTPFWVNIEVSGVPSLDVPIPFGYRPVLIKGAPYKIRSKPSGAFELTLPHLEARIYRIPLAVDDRKPSDVALKRISEAIGHARTDWPAELTAAVNEAQKKHTKTLDILKDLRNWFSSNYLYSKHGVDARDDLFTILQHGRFQCSRAAFAFQSLSRDFLEAPTRMVEGYLASCTEEGCVKNLFNITHAWTEVYFDGEWHLLDATPFRKAPHQESTAKERESGLIFALGSYVAGILKLAGYVKEERSGRSVGKCSGGSGKRSLNSDGQWGGGGDEGDDDGPEPSAAYLKDAKKKKHFAVADAEFVIGSFDPALKDATFRNSVLANLEFPYTHSGRLLAWALNSDKRYAAIPLLYRVMSSVRPQGHLPALELLVQLVSQGILDARTSCTRREIEGARKFYESLAPMFKSALHKELGYTIGSGRVDKQAWCNLVLLKRLHVSPALKSIEDIQSMSLEGAPVEELISYVGSPSEERRIWQRDPSERGDELWPYRRPEDLKRIYLRQPHLDVVENIKQGTAFTFGAPRVLRRPNPGSETQSGRQQLVIMLTDLLSSADDIATTYKFLSMVEPILDKDAKIVLMTPPRSLNPKDPHATETLRVEDLVFRPPNPHNATMFGNVTMPTREGFANTTASGSPYVDFFYSSEIQELISDNGVVDIHVVSSWRGFQYASCPRVPLPSNIRMHFTVIGEERNLHFYCPNYDSQKLKPQRRGAFPDRVLELDEMIALPDSSIKTHLIDRQVLEEIAPQAIQLAKDVNDEWQALEGSPPVDVSRLTSENAKSGALWGASGELAPLALVMWNLYSDKISPAFKSTFLEWVNARRELLSKLSIEIRTSVFSKVLAKIAEST